MRSFAAKGRFANMLRDVPVHLITINSALLGAALVGLAQAAARTPSRVAAVAR
jgi:glucokinase